MVDGITPFVHGFNTFGDHSSKSVVPSRFKIVQSLAWNDLPRTPEGRIELARRLKRAL